MWLQELVYSCLVMKYVATPDLHNQCKQGVALYKCEWKLYSKAAKLVRIPSNNRIKSVNSDS